MITLLWPHRLLTAVRNLKALSSAVLSFSLTSRLSSAPYGFALNLKSRWRWGQTHVFFFFFSWADILHSSVLLPTFSGVSPQSTMLLVPWQSLKKRKEGKYFHIITWVICSLLMSRKSLQQFAMIFRQSLCFSRFWLVELVSITFLSIVASICDLSMPWLTLISPLINTGVLYSPL